MQGKAPDPRRWRNAACSRTPSNGWRQKERVWRNQSPPTPGGAAEGCSPWKTRQRLKTVTAIAHDPGTPVRGVCVGEVHTHVHTRTSQHSRQTARHGRRVTPAQRPPADDRQTESGARVAGVLSSRPEEARREGHALCTSRAGETGPCPGLGRHGEQPPSVPGLLWVGGVCTPSNTLKSTGWIVRGYAV